MDEYIDKQAFIADKRKLYCADCAHRKGVKNGKFKTLYEIGDAPCRSCGINDVLEDVEDYPAADVAEVRHGHWMDKHLASKFDGEYDVARCSRCNFEYMLYGTHYHPDYCCKCGAKMDEEGENNV